MRTYISEQSEEHVRVEGAFVSLVHDDAAVVVQVRLTQRFPQQDTVGHVLDQGFLLGEKKV